MPDDAPLDWNHYLVAWATPYLERLARGETVQFRPRGNSMIPKIQSGDLCTVEPPHNIQNGDIVLCKVNGHYYLHLVKAVKEDQYLIGNNKGRVNGWASRSNIFGKCTKVES